MPLAYVATGRGGQILAFDMTNMSQIQHHIEDIPPPFKPMRLVVTQRYLVAASNNELIVWEHDGTFVRRISATATNDCINGWVTLHGDEVAYSCTFSNQLVTQVLPNGVPSSTLFPQPCHIVANPERIGVIYVTGHMDGMVTSVVTGAALAMA